MGRFLIFRFRELEQRSLHGVFPGAAGHVHRSARKRGDPGPIHRWFEYLPAGLQGTSKDGLKVRGDCDTIISRQNPNPVRFLGLDSGDFGGADY